MQVQVGWYTPNAGSTGFSNGCSGINIHTRKDYYSGGGSKGYVQSEGCQLISYGNSSSNGFNAFMKAVAGITWNSWLGGGSYNTFATTGTNMGYYVLDRQLGLVSPSGVAYGSGSLASLYTRGDLDAITGFSTSARGNASFSYFDKITTYPSNCKIKINAVSPINTLPASIGTDGSETLEEAVVGDEYIATAMYKNTYGNFWYRITTKSGKTAYIYAEDTTFVSAIDTDVKISGVSYPNAHVKGNYFIVNGTISSTYNELTDVGLYLIKGFGKTGEITSTALSKVSGNSISLASSDLDNNTLFDQLGTGKYTYMMHAAYKSYYATSKNTMKEITDTKEVMLEYFMVVPSSVSQSGCSHSYETTALKAATCTGSGNGVKSCTKCGLVSKVTLNATGHKPAGAVKENVVEGVSYDSVVYCSVCNKQISRQNIKIEKETESSGEKETESSGEKETESSGEKETESSGEKETESGSEKETESGSEKETESGSEKETESSGEKETEGNAVENKKELYNSLLVSEIKDYTYNGKAITQEVVLKDGNKTLTKGIDYTVEFVNNTNAGTAVVIIEGKGSYSGTIIKRFQIKKKVPANVKVTLEQSKYKYTGRSIKPNVTVKYGDKVLKKNADYDVAYSNNLKPGKATVTITFKKNYSGKAKQTFNILPSKVTGQKQAASAKKSVTIKWKKLSGVSGYQVYRSTKKNGKYTKVKTIKGNKTKYKNSKLKSGTTYYYKIRAYKKVGKSYIYGEYSNVVSATTKPLAVKVKTKAGRKQATISWNRVKGAKGYEIYMATSKNGKYKKISTKNSSATRVTKTKLTAKKTYYFKVRAYTKTPSGKKIYSGYSKVKKVKVK